MRKRIFLLMASALAFLAVGAKEKTVSDVAYRAQAEGYAKECCKLDVYYDDAAKDCPVVVWFHGGGLTGGNKEIPEQLKRQGLVVVGVGYRLLPKVTVDDCLDDCAAAVAWAFDNASKYGGDARKIFVSGHSAGGYITAMLGLDKSWLKPYGVDADSIVGLVPFSAQVISHFSYRKMNGIDNLQPTIDRFAPLFHVRADSAPMVLITGDRDLELMGRYEENAYMWRMMKLVGHPDVTLYELGGHSHCPMMEPAFHILLETVKRLTGQKYAL